MAAQRKVSLFRNGANQAIRIPREFELSGQQAWIRQEGKSLIIEPVERMSLLDLLDQMEPIDADFWRFDDPEPRPVDL
jgi:antitoxin VapB